MCWLKKKKSEVDKQDLHIESIESVAKRLETEETACRQWEEENRAEYGARWDKKLEGHPYNPASWCPKCNGTNISTIYRPERIPFASISYYGTGIQKIAYYAPERMKRICFRCEYTWYERPTDYKEDEQQ